MNTDGVGDADDVDDGFPYNFFSSFSSVSPIQISLSSLCMSCVYVCVCVVDLDAYYGVCACFTVSTACVCFGFVFGLPELM